ncbi:MAG: hypothetical protein ACTSVV_06595 [Promethearchaeota archaeon]
MSSEDIPRKKLSKYNYYIDSSEIQKSIKYYSECLGPKYDDYFNIEIKKKIQYHIIFEISGFHQFTSRSKFGNVKYTAFNYRKKEKIILSYFDHNLIENFKRDFINKEFNHWNGRIHYYTSPTGRHISRTLKVKRKNFHVKVDQIIVKIIPTNFLITSTHSNLTLTIEKFQNKKKICVSCCKSFKPVSWKGWSDKYLLKEGVYQCQNCNQLLDELINKEKIERSKFNYFYRFYFILLPVILILFFISISTFTLFLSIISISSFLVLNPLFILFFLKEKKRRKSVLDKISKFTLYELKSEEPKLNIDIPSSEEIIQKEETISYPEKIAKEFNWADVEIICLIIFENETLTIKKSLYCILPEISSFLKTMDIDEKKAFFQTKYFQWRRGLNILNLDNYDKKRTFFENLKKEVINRKNDDNNKKIELIINLNDNKIVSSNLDNFSTYLNKIEFQNFTYLSLKEKEFKNLTLKKI